MVSLLLIADFHLNLVSLLPCGSKLITTLNHCESLIFVHYIPASNGQSVDIWRVWMMKSCQKNFYLRNYRRTDHSMVLRRDRGMGYLCGIGIDNDWSHLCQDRNE